MSKMIKVDILKEVLKDVIPVDENGTKALEAIMENAEDFDEEAINTQIADATAKAKEEAAAEYAQKLHDTFFAPAQSGNENADQTTPKPEPEDENIPMFEDLIQK